MSTSKNLKLTTWLGGLLAPRFLSTGLAVVVTAVLLPAGKSAAWDGDRGDNEGVADRGALRPVKKDPGPGALNKPHRGTPYYFYIAWVAHQGPSYYFPDSLHLAACLRRPKT